MNWSRRDLPAAAGLFALGAAALAGPALADTEDETVVKKAVEELKAAWLKQDKANGKGDPLRQHAASRGIG